MYKKIVLSVFAAILVSVLFSGSAIAAEGDQPDVVKARGEVISVDPGAGKFRLETPAGEVLSFFTNEDTNYRGKITSLDDLQVGWKAGVRARVDEAGKQWAVLVIAGDGSDIIKARGEVTQVDPIAGQFNIKNPDGNVLTFLVDEKTRYTGQIDSLDDLQVGWKAGVVAKEGDGDKLIAIAVVAGDAPELIKTKGIVSSVDPRSGKFEIEKIDGANLLFFVDENTRYQGQLSSLDDMQVGWHAAVAAKEGEGGDLVAVLVIAGTRPELVRAKGVIKNVNAGSGIFRLEKPDGTVLTIQVDENTNYRGQVESFGDLEKGMRAGIAGIVQEDGSILAKLVLAGEPRPEGPPAGRPGPESEGSLDPRPFDNLSVPSGANL